VAISEEVRVTKSAENWNKVLRTRRALLADPLSVAVHRWLRRAYWEPSKRSLPAATAAMAGMVSQLEPLLEKHPPLGTALQSVSRFISRPVAKEYAEAFESVKRPEASLLNTFVSVVYARALMLLMYSGKDNSKIQGEVGDVLANPASFISEYEESQKKLDESFVSHLIAAAEIEAQLDPHFRNVLERSAALFIEAHQPEQGGRNPLVEPGARLEVLGDDKPAAWWRLPTSVAFAMTVWHQDA
jgi:hypothetical protein